MLSRPLISIGTVKKLSEECTSIEMNKMFIPGLTALQGFSHLMVLYWCHLIGESNLSESLILKSPYKTGPESLGVFASRSPFRPNPIAVSIASIASIDYDTGIITFHYLDAESDSPVLDIKPYTPSLDRSISATVPDWCSHWPKNLEQSDSFDWRREFNFGM